jgi:hypothetical protein
LAIEPGARHLKRIEGKNKACLRIPKIRLFDGKALLSLLGERDRSLITSF